MHFGQSQSFLLGNLYQISKIPKNLFAFLNSPDPDQRAPTGALRSGSELFERDNIMDSPQGAIGLKGLTD